jgi:hypothetical protein
MRARMRRDVVEQERLNDLLRELAAHDARAEPSSRVERAVMKRRMEGFATGRSAVAVPPALSDHRPRRLAARVAMGVVGVAAALLVVAWAGTGRMEPREPVVPTLEGTSTVVPAESVPLVAPAEAQRVPLNSKEQPSATAPSRVARAGAGVQPFAAEVEPFVRLLPLMEEELGTIRLARVRLPDQAIRTLGLDIRTPLPGVDGFVEADVLLGEDGLARAIRFVR